MNLTESQLTAINHGDSNLQLIACAGSGKTEVIARRVAHLLGAGCRPGNIIAFTFTEKAAAELKERILSRCKEELGEIHGMAEMYIGTIHGFCLDLLTAEVPKYLKFDVLNEVQQSLFIDRHSNQSGLTASTDLTGQLLKRYKDTPHYLSAISILREADLDEVALKNCSCSLSSS
jgi:DNA helicase-2/ATP-dependent DNA helicase PcrA